MPLGRPTLVGSSRTERQIGLGARSARQLALINGEREIDGVRKSAPMITGSVLVAATST